MFAGAVGKDRGLLAWKPSEDFIVNIVLGDVVLVTHAVVQREARK